MKNVSPDATNEDGLTALHQVFSNCYYMTDMNTYLVVNYSCIHYVNGSTEIDSHGHWGKMKLLLHTTAEQLQIYNTQLQSNLWFSDFLFISYIFAQ